MCYCGAAHRHHSSVPVAELSPDPNAFRKNLHLLTTVPSTLAQSCHKEIIINPLTMVFGGKQQQRKRLDVETSVDLRIVSNFYSPPSRGAGSLTSASSKTAGGSSSYYSPKEIARLLNENGNSGKKKKKNKEPEPSSEVVVVSLSDLSAARQYSERKITRLPSRLLSRLLPAREERQKKNKRRGKGYNYGREILKKNSKTDINAVVGVKMDSLLDDDTSETSSEEDEELVSYLLNNDVDDDAYADEGSFDENHRASTNPRATPAHSTQSAWSFKSQEPDDDPWSFFSWMFGCTEGDRFASLPSTTATTTNTTTTRAKEAIKNAATDQYEEEEEEFHDVRQSEARLGFQEFEDDQEDRQQEDEGYYDDEESENYSEGTE